MPAITPPGRPAQPDERRLVYLGFLTKPQGIRGGIRMLPEFDDIDDFEQLKTDRLFIKPAPQASLRPAGKPAWREITLSEFQPHQRFVIVLIEEAPDMNSAELLRNHEVYVYEEEMWDLPEGRYYTWQLAGLDLFDSATGQVAGKVIELRPGFQDYLVVKGPIGEFLVPYVPEIIEKVELDTGRVIARLPEGLAEI